MASVGLKLILLYAVLQVFCAEDISHLFLNGRFSHPVNYTSKRFLQAGSQYFRNNLDHFNNNDITFNQRYWSNDEHYKQGGPVFLAVGGEVPLSPAWIMEEHSPINIYASATGAHMYSLEHRMYGQSVPSGVQGMYRYLTIDQALEDIAAFIKMIKHSQPQLENSRWVLFGGSYAGNLAVWSRAKYPDLVYAAVASSAPVDLKMEFPEFLEAVKAAIESVSQGCAQSVANGFATVAKLRQTEEGRRLLRNSFRNANGSMIRDVSNIGQRVIYTYENIAQIPSGDNSIIRRDICAFHETNDSPIEKMRKVHANHFNYTVRRTGSPVFKTLKSNNEDAGAWLWQMCNEFGNFHTTSSSAAGPFFGGIDTIPLSVFEKVCQADARTIGQRIRETNNKYGGKRPRATNLILPYGTMDPWIGRQITEPSNGIIPIRIQGATHCADMKFLTDHDSEILNNARHSVLHHLEALLQR